MQPQHVTVILEGQPANVPLCSTVSELRMYFAASKQLVGVDPSRVVGVAFGDEDEEQGPSKPLPTDGTAIKVFWIYHRKVRR